MTITPENLKGKVFLAPMAGYCDIVYRRIADRFGADGTVSEMVSAKALRYGDRKSRELMRTKPHRGFYGIQLFGSDPEDFAFAAKLAAELHPDFIDINMGCPVPKVTSGGSGSALMKNIPLAREIVSACRKNSKGIPVSVKMRTGWDDDSITCGDLATRAEKRGASFLTVHGRTKKQMYKPGIALEYIKLVKESVRIPVIANGDIADGESRKKLLEDTGADRVMIGRAALGNPWIFPQVKGALEGKEIFSVPPAKDKMEIFLEHTRGLCEVSGEELGMKRARGQAVHYLKGMRGAARLREMTSSLSTYRDRVELARKAVEQNPEEQK